MSAEEYDDTDMTPEEFDLLAEHANPAVIVVPKAITTIRATWTLGEGLIVTGAE